MFKLGVVFYQKEIVIKDINDLKVIIYLVLLYILNCLCCFIWCYILSKYLIIGERCYFFLLFVWDN